MKKLLIGLFISIIALTLVGSFWFINRGCESKKTPLLLSPTNEYLAYLEQTDCGATGPLVTDVVLKRAGVLNSIPIFSVAAYESYKGYLESVSLEWIDDHTLNICARLPLFSEGLSSWEQVKVTHDCGKL
jgi:hypothetical protein